MSEHIIRYNLPEEQEELEIVLTASRLNSFLRCFELDVLHSYTKYGIPEDFIIQLSDKYDKDIDYELVQATIQVLSATYYKLKSEYNLTGD